VDTLLQVIQAVALVCVSALCVYLIVVLTQVKRDLADFTHRSKPILENVAFITDRLKSAAEKVDSQVDIVKGSLHSLKSAADDVRMFEQRVRESLEEPVFQMISMFGAIVTAIAAVIERFRSK
jgi:hypothetical protein